MMHHWVGAGNFKVATDQLLRQSGISFIRAKKYPGLASGAEKSGPPKGVKVRQGIQHTVSINKSNRRSTLTQST